MILDHISILKGNFKIIDVMDLPIRDNLYIVTKRNLHLSYVNYNMLLYLIIFIFFISIWCARLHAHVVVCVGVVIRFNMY